MLAETVPDADRRLPPQASHAPRVEHCHARLAFTMAAFNVLVQWHGLRPNASGFRAPRWRSLVCKIPVLLLSLSETNTIGYYTRPTQARSGVRRCQSVGLSKGISHPQNHIFMPGFTVDHQTNRQAMTGKATRHRQATQIQNIANNRGGEILHIPCAVRAHGGVNLSDWVAGGIIVVGRAGHPPGVGSRYLWHVAVPRHVSC